ncbi:MAG: spermidine synthase [Archaeoglobaceae archaeon]
MEFVERYDGSGILIKVRRKLADVESIQHIEVYETESFGKMLVIDGKIQLTEFDEALYHEMLAHVPLMLHEKPRDVLIIGGGDGGTLREVLKHDVRRVTLVEIDVAVLEVAKKFLGIDRGAFEDERVEIVIEDGKTFVSSCERYDVIIVDSTDPVGVSDPLFGREFFELAREKCDVICAQAQSPLVQRDLFLKIWNAASVFGRRAVYLATVPTYPLAYWAFVIAGDFGELREERFERLRGKVRHYNPDVHRAAFALPEWLREVL